MYKVLIAILGLSALVCKGLAAEVDMDKVVLARIYIDENGDTLPHIVMRPVYCFAKPKFKSAKEERNYYKEYARMVYNLKKVYPYAHVIKKKLQVMDAEMAKLPDDKARKEYLDKAEKELFSEFEAPLRRMTISQGKMLIKLVDRETGRTSYQVIKELKGKFSAFMWQAVAVVFSSSLKLEFDQDGEDKILNELIILYEAGLL